MSKWSRQCFIVLKNFLPIEKICQEQRGAGSYLQFPLYRFVSSTLFLIFRNVLRRDSQIALKKQLFSHVHHVLFLDILTKLKIVNFK